MKKVLFSAFTDLNQDELSTYSKNVVTLMTANPIFIKLMPNVDELKALNLNYSKALEENISGGKPATAEKDKAKKLVVGELKTIGTFISVMAKGDVTVIYAAGFNPTRDKTVFSKLETPTVLELTNLADTGLAIVRLSSVAGATNYGIKKRIKTADANAPWDASEYNSATKLSIRVDVPKKDYQFIFRVLGNSGHTSVWSHIYELFIS